MSPPSPNTEKARHSLFVRQGESSGWQNQQCSLNRFVHRKSCHLIVRKTANGEWGQS